MKIKVFLILLAVIFTLITLKSDTQVPVVSEIRFKVCVYVKPNDDTDLDSRLEAFLCRELRALGDVDIVKRDADWHYFLAYSFLEITQGGTKTGELSIARAFMEFHPDVAHKTYRFPELGKPATFGGISAAFWYVDNLHEYAIQTIVSFDKQVLERFRSK